MVETDEKTSPQRPRTPDDASIPAVATGTSLNGHSQYNLRTPNGEPLRHGEAPEKQESSDGADLTEVSEDTEDLEGANVGEVFENRDGVEDVRDVEIGRRPSQSRSAKSASDPNLVNWDGPDDPENPRNWGWRRKWAATFIGTLTPSCHLDSSVDECGSIFFHFHIPSVFVDGCPGP
jgi:hypothetical protein